MSRRSSLQGIRDCAHGGTCCSTGFSDSGHPRRRCRIAHRRHGALSCCTAAPPQHDAHTAIHCQEPELQGIHDDDRLELSLLQLMQPWLDKVRVEDLGYGRKGRKKKGAQLPQTTTLTFKYPSIFEQQMSGPSGDRLQLHDHLLAGLELYVRAGALPLDHQAEGAGVRPQGHPLLHQVWPQHQRGLQRAIQGATPRGWYSSGQPALA